MTLQAHKRSAILNFLSPTIEQVELVRQVIKLNDSFKDLDGKLALSKRHHDQQVQLARLKNHAFISKKHNLNMVHSR